MKGKLDDTLYRRYISMLPAAIQNRVNRFHFWQDAQRSLFGKLLLMKGLDVTGLTGYTLDQLSYSEYQRPYFKSADFNISHSGAFIICAISKTNRVGIDIEEINDIPTADFTAEFSATEMAAISDDKSLRYFYSLWTQKEAFLKAIGKGLQVPLNQVSVKENKIRWENEDWFLHEIKLDAGYVSHLCIDAVMPEIVLQEIEL